MTNDQIWQFVNLFCRSHPWHGVEIGEGSPSEIHCFIEIVPTDTVKFEVDKRTGLLKADRPQKYSNYCPSLYGFIPQTHAGRRVGEYSAKKLGRSDIKGDDDPVDICVFSEKEILRGDILLTVIPIGGIRAIDGDEADDKIIAVLKDDLVYGSIKDIKDCPQNLIDRLCHYFLTYKDYPGILGKQTKRKMEITHIYGRDEAMEIIQASVLDYDDKFPGIRDQLKLLNGKN